MPGKTKTGEDNPFVNNTLMRSMKGLVAHRRGSNQSRLMVNKSKDAFRETMWSFTLN